MTTVTKRYIIPSGSFNEVCKSLASGSYSPTAVTSSCNWDDKVWCDITFTYDISGSADALSESCIHISKRVWNGIAMSSSSLDSTYDIAIL